MNGIVHLVLNGGVEPFGRKRGCVVVDGGGVEVCDFLVELPLAGTDFTNALQLLVKVLVREERASFEAFVIHHPTLDGVLRGNGV